MSLGPNPDLDYTKKYRILSSRFVFADYTQRREIIEEGRLIGLNISPPDNQASFVTLINEGKVNTTPEEQERYLEQVRITAPPPPINLSAIPGNRQIIVSFEQKSNGGSPILNYEYSLGGPFRVLNPPDSKSPIILLNIPNGATYTIRLKAVNAVGVSVASESVTVTLDPGAPEPPTNLVAISENTQTTISFLPGEMGGSPITNYWYNLNFGSFIALSPADSTSPITITGLTNGVMYVIRLKAENALGLSTDESSPVTVIPSTIPNPPTGLSGTSGNEQVTISFSQDSTGGSAITRYWYNLNGGTFTALPSGATASPLIIPDLINGVAYTIRLKAENINGLSSESSSISVTPLPDIPEGDIFTTFSGNVGVTFTNDKPSSYTSGGSYLFNGTSHYLYLNGNTSWAFGTADFTIEWVYRNTSSKTAPRIFSIGAWPNAQIACSIEFGTLWFWVLGIGYQFGIDLPLNTWIHIAIVRIKGIVTVYKDGIKIGDSISITGNLLNNTTRMYIAVENNGAMNTTNTFFGGNITNFRIIKGLGIYTGNFSAPNSYLSLTSSVNPYGGSNTSAIPTGFTKLLILPSPIGNIYTSPTVFANGTIENFSPFASGKSYRFLYGQTRLSIEIADSWTFGNDDFTIEWFVYIEQVGVTPRQFSYPDYSLGISASRPGLQYGKVYVIFKGSDAFDLGSLSELNTWIHWAVVRSQGYIKLYRNGSLVYNIANNGNMTAVAQLDWGWNTPYNEPAESLHGFMTNMRVVKGLAVYTGNFTRPTSSLTLTAPANPYGGSNTQAIPAGYTKLLLVPT